MLRINLDENSIIEASIEKPYEVHLIQFESEKDFEGFLQDEERTKFLHLKEDSIRESFLIKGKKL